MTKTLVERLVRERHTREDWHEPYGAISLPCDADDYGAEAHLINPDGPEAAAEITRLASRIEELERALKVADHDLTTTHNLRATDLSPAQMNEALNRGVALSDLEWMTDNSRGLEATRQALSDKG
jgi:hypothetical protein